MGLQKTNWECVQGNNGPWTDPGRILNGSWTDPASDLDRIRRAIGGDQCSKSDQFSDALELSFTVLLRYLKPKSFEHGFKIDHVRS